MKILLTFLTIVMFNFGANASTQKFSEKRCADIIKFATYEYERIESLFFSGKSFNKNLLDDARTQVSDYANIYQAFCKD